MEHDDDDVVVVGVVKESVCVFVREGDNKWGGEFKINKKEKEVPIPIITGVSHNHIVTGPLFSCLE